MPTARRFVTGDIHGAHKALLQCFSRSGFDYKNDQLICLGDVCDGWSDSDKVFDELFKIKHLIYVLGNHDLWAIEWAKSGNKPKPWLKQGGSATIKCYPKGMPTEHQNLIKKAYNYYISDNKLFVHGGCLTDVSLKEQNNDIFLWDRSLAEVAMQMHALIPRAKLTKFDEIYIGHTSLSKYNIFHPAKYCNVWLMDTGAGWDGPLSIMNIDTNKVYQSERVYRLYQGIKGRID